mgnify:CR=1 FL=1
MKHEVSAERAQANALIASLHEAKSSATSITDVARKVRNTKVKNKEISKTATTSTANTAMKVRKDIKNYDVIAEHLIRYKNVEDMSSYAKRLYLKQSHNSDTETDIQERALSTFYRDQENKLQLYNRASAYTLVKQYLDIAKTAKQDFIVTREVEKHYKVFGPAISDNTLAIFRKLSKELSLKLEAIKDSEASKRIKYYKLYVNS